MQYNLTIYHTTKLLYCKGVFEGKLEETEKRRKVGEMVMVKGG
jgi:hypothetical protein